MVRLCPSMLTFIRCLNIEWIVEDIAVYCGDLLLIDAGEADREVIPGHRMPSSLPGGVIDISIETDRQIRTE